MARRHMSVAERISYLHDSEKYFDVEFVLLNNGQSVKVKGHRAIFASSSEAFEAMLYGPMAMGDTIEMSDVDMEAFMTLRKFIYTDDVAFQSVAHAQNVFKVADMYDLMQLSRVAEAFISANLSSTTALRILEFTRSYQKVDMLEECLQVIRRETSAVLNSDDFLSCDGNFVDVIVSETELNIKEIDLFNSVEKWAENNMNIEDDPSANEAQLLSRVIDKIRFLSMTAEEFAKGPGKSSLLTEHESYCLLMNIATPGSTQLPDRFSKERTPRNGDSVAASNTNLDFTSSKIDYITTIKWTMRGMSTLKLNVKYDSPRFEIDEVPFTIYFKQYMRGTEKRFLIGLRCDDDDINCMMHVTERYIREEGEPLSWNDWCTFDETGREVEKWGWNWFCLFYENCISSDDSFTIEMDFENFELIYKPKKKEKI